MKCQKCDKPAVWSQRFGAVLCNGCRNRALNGRTNKRQIDKSDLERSFLFYVNSLDLPKPVTEWRFHPVRRWRFDFAWPDRMVAVECEGGTWSRGRHVRGKGFEGDCWKYNTAAVLGWKVLRVTGGMLDGNPLDFLELLIQALGENRIDK